MSSGTPLAGPGALCCMCWWPFGGSRMGGHARGSITITHCRVLKKKRNPGWVGNCHYMWVSEWSDILSRKPRCGMFLTASTAPAFLVTSHSVLPATPCALFRSSELTHSRLHLFASSCARLLCTWHSTIRYDLAPFFCICLNALDSCVGVVQTVMQGRDTGQV
jgi:hypothetical protein